MLWSDDPIRDFLRWDFERERQMEELRKKAPCCRECGENVLDCDFVYDIDGDYICENCMENKRINTERWLE